MGRMDGKVVLISGGARGMGASHARLLVAEGARVLCGDVLDEEGQALADELGPNATYVHLDVTQEAAWQAAVELCISVHGPPTGLVNNAGIVRWGTIVDQSLDDVRV